MSQQLKGRFPLKSYKKLKPRLGGGAFGSVWKYKKVSDVEDFPEFVAVKECYPDDCEREVEIFEKVAKNGHENVVNCFGIVESEFYMLFVLELCDSDLHNHLKENQAHLDQQTLLNYSCQIANGIHHLHGLDIVHRDIKPMNVLLKKSSRGNVLKVTDFGGSKQLMQKGTQEGSIVGTQFYMSPEMLVASERGKKPQHNPMKSDIYSLGLVLIHIHHGPELVLDIFDERQKSPAHMVANSMESSGGIRDIIMKMLQGDPRKRPSIESVKDFLETKVNTIQVLL